MKKEICQQYQILSFFNIQKKSLGYVLRELEAQGIETTQEELYQRLTTVDGYVFLRRKKEVEEMSAKPKKRRKVKSKRVGRPQIVPESVMKEYNDKNLTPKQIHEKLLGRGYNLSEGTVYRYIKDFGINVAKGRKGPKVSDSDVTEEKEVYIDQLIEEQERLTANRKIKPDIEKKVSKPFQIPELLQEPIKLFSIPKTQLGYIPEEKSHCITVGELSIAVMNSVDKKMKEDDARDIANRVMNFFGYSERIIDNILEPEDRDVFYMLEDTGLLTTEREETVLYDGRGWRIHYWLFKKDKIRELVRGTKKVLKQSGEKVEAFDYEEEVPENVWDSRKEAEEATAD
ncbi:MAG: DUF6015 family protein [Candidatus Aenigmatarchaeota archaeon]